MPDENEEEQRARLSKQRQQDEAMAFLADQVPAMARRMFLGLVSEGFSEADALRVVMAYLHAMIKGPLL